MIFLSMSKHTWIKLGENLFYTLLGLPPVCVLRLLADAVVSLLDPKTPSFTGGGGSARNWVWTGRVQ
jgi:hypothetical protein